MLEDAQQHEAMVHSDTSRVTRAMTKLHDKLMRPEVATYDGVAEALTSEAVSESDTDTSDFPEPWVSTPYFEFPE